MLFGNNLQKTIVGHLEQRPSRSKEIKELFRFVICAKWPETASYSARHYYAIVVTHHIGFKIAVCAQNYYFSRITQVLYTKYNLLGRLNKMTCPDANFFTLIHSVLKFIFSICEKKWGRFACISGKTPIFAPQLRTMVLQFAQMAESVDALVSNTSGFTSIPVRPRVWVQKRIGC